MYNLKDNKKSPWYSVSQPYKTLDKRGISYSLGEIVSSVSYGNITVKTAMDEMKIIYEKIKKDIGPKNVNVYTHPDFKQFLATMLYLSDQDAVTVSAYPVNNFNKMAHKEQNVFNAFIEPLMYGYFLYNIEGIPTSVFNLAEKHFKMFQKLRVREEAELAKIGQTIGDIRPDMDYEMSPWFFIGGYFPLSEQHTDETGEVGLRDWTKGSHVNRRTEQISAMPDNVDLSAVIVGSIRARIRNIHEAVPYQQAYEAIGSEASNTELRQYMEKNLPGETAIIDAWARQGSAWENNREKI